MGRGRQGRRTPHPGRTPPHHSGGHARHHHRGHARTHDRRTATMTTTFVPTPRQRRDRVYVGVRLGYTVAEIARYLEVSPSTIRRDLAAMPSLREDDHWPDAYRG